MTGTFQFCISYQIGYNPPPENLGYWPEILVVIHSSGWHELLAVFSAMINTDFTHPLHQLQFNSKGENHWDKFNHMYLHDHIPRTPIVTDSLIDPARQIKDVPLCALNVTVDLQQLFAVSHTLSFE